MRILILGLGVIGTTYAYALQKAGHPLRYVCGSVYDTGKAFNVEAPLFYRNYDTFLRSV